MRTPWPHCYTAQHSTAQHKNLSTKFSHFSLSLFFATSLLLSGCGGEESATNTSTTSHSATEAQAAPQARAIAAASLTMAAVPEWTKGKPSIRELMDAAGIPFLEASNILYGSIGSNADSRDWNAIMNTGTDNIVATAKQATAQMYGGYRIVTTSSGNGYTSYIISGTGVLLTSAGTATTAEAARAQASASFANMGFYSLNAQGQPDVSSTSGSGTTSITISNDIDFSYQPPTPPPTVTATPPTLAAISNQNATQGQAYSLALASLVSATDGDSISSYAIAGTLPTGVSLNTSTGVLSGTPSQSGTYTLSATASDKDGASGARSFTLTVAAPPPTASLSKTSDALEGNNLTFTLTLDAAANGITTAQISYSAPSPLPSGTIAATGASNCTGTADYTNTTTSVDIASGQTSASFTVPTCVNANTLQASSVKVTLSGISGNAQLSSTASNLTKDVIIYNNSVSGKLNDTGVLLYGTASTAGTQSNSLEVTHADAIANTPAQQDAAHGRDAQALAATLAKVGASSQNTGKNNGFDFTKISSTGLPLAANALSWDCVLDNNTGLMWENKTDDNGLRDKDHTYTWYNTDTTNNGGNAGTANGGTCTGGTGCDTEKYVADVNTAAGLCGYTNWRMPTVEELQSIADMGRTNPAIDPSYFPTLGNHDDSYVYWSSQAFANGTHSAWVVNFNFGLGYWTGKSDGLAVRLVRSQ